MRRAVVIGFRFFSVLGWIGLLWTFFLVSFFYYAEIDLICFTIMLACLLTLNW